MSAVTISDALARTGLFKRAGLKSILPADAMIAGGGIANRAAPKFRSRDRYGLFRQQVFAQAAQIALASPGREDEIFAKAEEMAAFGPDWAHYRRDSKFMAPPRVKIDRNEATRILSAARLIERRSYAKRKKGAHGGLIGRSAMILLETLLFVVKKSRGCFASLDRLAQLSRLSRRTVVTAMAILERFGFVTVHRRIRREGGRVVQDSNAYEIHRPRRGIGALACTIFGAFSECKKNTARETGNNSGTECGGGDTENGLWRGSERARPPTDMRRADE